MNELILLLDEISNPPLKRRVGENYIHFVSSQLNQYKTWAKKLQSTFLNEFGDIDSTLYRIDDICHDLLESQTFYLEGRPGAAYQLLAEMIENNLSSTFDLTSANLEDILFRVRVSDEHFESKGDIFHIRFQERTKVTSYRFSIPGLPCLYLSGSLYTCWKEVNSPPLHRLRCSGFAIRPGKSLKLLDLRNPIQRFRRLLANKDSRLFVDFLDDVKRIMKVWPLIIVTMIKVLHPNDPFKPEYSLSQLLLEWVREQEIYDGIAYTSTKALQLNVANSVLFDVNVAFPAKSINDHGLCESLCSYFLVTFPEAWDLLRQSKKGRASAKNDKYEIIRGSFESYQNSEFDLVQNAIEDRLFYDINYGFESGFPRTTINSTD